MAVNKYGVQLPAKIQGKSEILQEFVFFLAAPFLEQGTMQWQGRYTGQGRAQHAKRLVEIIPGLANKFDMHSWASDQFDLFSEYKWAAITGPAAGGKSTAAALWALFFWLSDPKNTGVLLTSTTLDGLKKRIWGYVQRYWKMLRPFYPEANEVFSRCMIQSEKGDDSNGIFGIAVAAGDEEKALGRIIGFHPDRLLVIIDEATDTPKAIVDACANLQKTKVEFQLIVIGNAKDPLDEHGKLCEPKAGWSSITVNDTFWETKLGACLHLDSYRSPNLDGGRQYSYLPSEKTIKASETMYGKDSAKFWRFDRGFWPPEGSEQIVVSQSMFDKSDCKAPAAFVYSAEPVAGLDQSRGGDRCILRMGRFGQTKSGKTMIEFTDMFPLSLNANTPANPIAYQIAQQSREICMQKNVKPSHFGMDETGDGASTADIVCREWSPAIHRVNFQAAATERAVSQENPKQCKDEYANFVTELWFAFRYFLLSDQIRGLRTEDMRDFVSRYWLMKGARYQVEPKPEMRARCGFSPDIGDADCIVVEVCRRHGMVPIHSREAAAGTKSMNDAIREVAKRMDIQDTYSDVGIVVPSWYGM